MKGDKWVSDEIETEMIVEELTRKLKSKKDIKEQGLSHAKKESILD